ncbi:hypothetical protein [Flavobacterium sp. K5-23]|uniref:hypothetical protein n=1 Tax=Flavobacterium sp. K5-23 TaxID=2746225 RepID=UPI00200F866B|nr:hypothetical protein [Flavobacterium sp. K5-23]UQD55966.1 hypothetical protein FLAK523_05940 [Flavobacterium sp. K5-23]
MKYLFYTLLVTAITITSCKNNDTEKEQADPSTVVPFWQQSTSAVQGQSTLPTETQNNSKIATATLPGMNPPHGQPNHRCDIPDGAPLNSPGNGTAAGPSATAQPLQIGTSTQTATAKTVTPKGVNPPHGESGHRCDIAVGAPLNSKPLTTTSENSDEASQKYTLQQPVPALLSTTATETPSGMNPEHGKDGHRCDIAVGAPLPKS